MGSRVGKPGAFLAVGQLVRGPHRAHAPLQRRHALLEHVVRGVLLRVGFWIVMGVDDKKLERFFLPPPRSPAFWGGGSIALTSNPQRRACIRGARAANVDRQRRGGMHATHHDPAVDVPERAEAEEIGTVLTIIENIRCGGVNGHGARVRRGVRHLTGVHLFGGVGEGGGGAHEL